MTKIVRLKKADIPACADIHALLKQLSPNSKSSTSVTLKKMLRNPGIEIWVARDGARIVGMATLIISHQLRGISVHVDDVVVDESYRGRGLGKSLMKKMMERAHANRAHEIELTSKPSRVAANSMYQKLGFKKRETNVYNLKF